MPMPPPAITQRSRHDQSKDVASQRASRSNSPQKRSRDLGSGTERADTSDLTEYKLTECLGRGAFGSVWRAFNWSTGETVAIKKIKLSDLGKTELRNIMVEIDLLKDLHHPNIVKYHGFVKSTEALNIILEFCENGSLHSLHKSHGKFPEQLAARFMFQVLNGLIYLHDQGVIHRDIKGANILLTKEGLVKLADFGVATNSPELHQSSVVGTPYWMAPEVVELAGATTASDIWSVGCTVIEMLEGKPPYHQYQPLPALFHIVQDDHPPFPDSFSPSAQDFLMQCFQKDPNLRISAKKLIRHPWIVLNRRADATEPVVSTKYDEAVKSVQEWNEALKSPEATLRRGPMLHLQTPLATDPKKENAAPRVKPDAFRSPDLADSDNWDDDFASSISSSALQLPQLRPIDRFQGAMSPDKLKAFATLDNRSLTQYEESDSQDDSFGEFDGFDSTRPDSFQTVRPTSPSKHQRQRSDKNSAAKVSQRVPSQPKTQILRPPTQAIQKPRSKGVTRSSSLYRESSIEDYSDLIDDDGIALDEKLNNVLKTKQDEVQAKTKPGSSPSFPERSIPLRHKKAGSLRHIQSTREFEQENALRRSQSTVEIQKYAEKIEDEDFSDIFGKDGTAVLPKPDSESGSDNDMAAMLNSRFSVHSNMDTEEDDDDPFLKLEEDLDPMDTLTRAARDKFQSKVDFVETLISQLRVPYESEDDEDRAAREDDLANLADISGQLFSALYEMPDLRQTVISAHGLLPILEVLDKCQQTNIALPLLKVVNIIILDSVEILENFCFVGAIPTVTRFAHRKYPSEIRLEAAAFVRQVYQSSVMTFQMFISCGGLYVLVEFLDEDYDMDRDLVLIGVNGVSSVFELQGSTPKNDICRILSRTSVLRPLSLLLSRALDDGDNLAELVKSQIVNIFFFFSQAENLVKERVADRLILNTVLNNLGRMSLSHRITMLKFIKNLSMVQTTLDSLHNANTIEHLTRLLRDNINLPHFKEMSNQVLNIMFNLCRLSKTRQEDAALAGLIPILQRIVKTDRPLKEFALPILCDMAHSGKIGRTVLWQNKGLQFYISLLADSYWQVTALDAIFVWLQEETAKVEGHLLRDKMFSEAIKNCFVSSKTDAFENLLEPLQKLLRLSPPVAASLENPSIFSRSAQRLHNNKKAVVRGNLLRIIRSICEASEQLHQRTGLLQKYDLFEEVRHIAINDPAILVRNMASELIKAADASNRLTHEGGRLRPLRRTSSSNAAQTPPSLYANSSQPPTPQHGRGSTPGYFDVFTDSSIRSRPSFANSTPYRPMSRDGNSSGSGSSSIITRMPSDQSSSTATTSTSTNSTILPSRSKLPRTAATHGSRQSLATAGTPTSSTADSPTPGYMLATRSTAAYNARKRRQTSAGETRPR